MDLAILCHCAKPIENRHPPLYIQSKPLYIKNKIPFVNSTTFINPKTGCSPDDTDTKEWREVPDNSIDIMWSRHCTIQLIFNREIIDENENGSTIIYHQSDPEFIFKDILNDGYRILRPNGKIYIPILEERSHNLEIVDPFMKTLTNNPWKTEIIKIEDSPILIGETLIKQSSNKQILGYNSSISTDGYSHLYVLTKLVKTGGMRLTRRHKKLFKKIHHKIHPVANRLQKTAKTRRQKRTIS